MTDERREALLNSLFRARKRLLRYDMEIDGLIALYRSLDPGDIPDGAYDCVTKMVFGLAEIGGAVSGLEGKSVKEEGKTDGDGA